MRYALRGPQDTGQVDWDGGSYSGGFFFFSSRRRHTRSDRDWSSDVCSSDLPRCPPPPPPGTPGSLLAPEYPAAVAAGNVETSQAITGALYAALGVMAEGSGTDRKSVV